MRKYVPSYSGTLRSHGLTLPHCISECSGIRIFGKRIKSIAFSTDAAIIKNINADAIIAVYPFTPQASISQAVINVADVPVFVGVGGGYTNGSRSVRLAMQAEHQGAYGGASFDEVYRVVEELQRHTHLLFSLESMHNLAQNGRVSKLAATAAGVLGIRAVGQASAEGTLEMLGKCRGERKTQEFLLQEMERLGYKGGSVRIGHCGNAAFSLELYTELRRRFPDADVRRYPLRGLCSYYAERGGIMMGFET